MTYTLCVILPDIMIDVTPLEDWYVTGKDLRKLAYAAGFTSLFSAGKYLDIDDSKLNRWSKLDRVPNGRILALALLALKYRAVNERLERELAALKQEKIA